MARPTKRVGRGGAVVIPVAMRRRLGLVEGSDVIVEERNGGIFVRPAATRSTRIYTPEQKAEFLLNNSIGAADYKAARAAVREMGLDPDEIAHQLPDVGRVGRALRKR